MGTATSLSRRGFLRGKKKPVDIIRPPGSPPEKQFTDQCQRCGDCISACETGVLINGDGGFPEINFKKAGCSFCQQCSEACRHKILSNCEDHWSHRPRINNDCLALNKVHCRTCQELCEAETIGFQLAIGGIALPNINLEQCTGCGECVSGCPVDAIKMQRFLQETYVTY